MVIFLREVAAEKRLDTQDAEIRGRDRQSTQMFRCGPCRKVVADRGVSGDMVEAFSEFLQALQLRRRKIHFIGLLFVGFGELDNAIRFGKRQRAEEDAVDDGEDRGVCADAECEGQDGNDSKGWGFCQYTQAVPKVLPESGHSVPRGRCGPSRLVPGSIAGRFLHRIRRTRGNCFRQEVR